MPFVHAGMHKVLPRGASVPALGNTVHVLAGEPIPVADILDSCTDMTEDQLHEALAERVGAALRRLQAQLEASVVEQVRAHLQGLCLLRAPPYVLAFAVQSVPGSSCMLRVQDTWFILLPGNRKITCL